MITCDQQYAHTANPGGKKERNRIRIEIVKNQNRTMESKYPRITNHKAHTRITTLRKQP